MSEVVQLSDQWTEFKARSVEGGLAVNVNEVSVFPFETKSVIRFEIGDPFGDEFKFIRITLQNDDTNSYIYIY